MNMGKENDTDEWPSHLVLPMMIMRENLRESSIEVRNTSPSFVISTDSSPPVQDEKAFVCADCGKSYKVRSSLSNHRKWECGKEPRFKCPYCTYKAKQKVHMIRHLRKTHKVTDAASIKSEIINEAAIRVRGEGTDLPPEEIS
ncbi:longitudinals lacking protein, isoforms F/I/K/T-like [Leptinotarsa decemlineata]|uniref:longitudinals lacking protein, isoforms F/I/K/T-like n=1 Tax=Leptinotarsa decemlineata TaxID=7539 RepID=UPI003D307A31